MDKPISGSTPYRFITTFYNQYRLVVPINGENAYEQAYCPLNTTLPELEQIIIDTMRTGGQSEKDITVLMAGFPNKNNKNGTKLRRHISATKNNHSGYLGVTPYANLKSIKYIATAFINGKIRYGEKQTLSLHFDHKTRTYWLPEKDIITAFARCCRSADQLRGRTVSTLETYKKYYKSVPWQFMLNERRKQRIQKDEQSFQLVLKSITPKHKLQDICA
jgi:hypothetical protein